MCWRKIWAVHPEDIAEQIREIKEVAVLKKFLRSAVKAKNIAEFTLVLTRINGLRVPNSRPAVLFVFRNAAVRCRVLVQAHSIC
ncbi:hypothetical protein [Desulfofundulus sp.]|uniref:hypothetical protein n=1 Tax=Desulfofundulus sp. TaxID=2282750 RepID=UPI003C774EAC